MEDEVINMEDAKKSLLEAMKEAGRLALFALVAYLLTGGFDLVVNTYSHNQDETLKFVLEKIGYPQK